MIAGRVEKMTVEGMVVDKVGRKLFLYENRNGSDMQSQEGLEMNE